MLIRRGVAARDYFAYCEEVGVRGVGPADQPGGRAGVPVAAQAPDRARTSEYVQGPSWRRTGTAPCRRGFEIVELPAAKYLRFQGEPFAEEDYCAAIEQVQGRSGGTTRR